MSDHTLGDVGICCSDYVIFYFFQKNFLTDIWSDLFGVSINLQSRFSFQILFRQSTSNDTRKCLSSTTSASSFVVSDAIFGVIRIISMIWTKYVFDISVIFGGMVFVTNDECDRMTCRFPLKDTRKYLKIFIKLFSLGRDLTLSRFSPS